MNCRNNYYCIIVMTKYCAYIFKRGSKKGQSCKELCHLQTVFCKKHVNKNTKIAPFIHGGSQERGMRGGTENLVGIVGLVTALDLANQDIEAHQKHVQGIKSHMIKELREIFPDISFHGEIEEDKSLYTVLNVCFPRTDKSAMLLFTLDLKGVAVSGGSACTSGAAKGSHVLEGIDADMTKPNVRFSFSRYTTLQEVDFALEQIKVIYDRILV